MSLDESLGADLAAMEKAGTLKSFRHITAPMDTEVTMAEKPAAACWCCRRTIIWGSPIIPRSSPPARRRWTNTARAPPRCASSAARSRSTNEIEKALAKLSHTESALTYVSCWAANTGLIPAVAGEDDALVSDALNHASLIDGCRGAKAKRLVYKHSDMKDLEAKLAEVKGARRIFIVTDGVFSMEGDIAKLPDIVALARKFNAAIILDDSHGTGVMGKHGRGTAEHYGVEGQIDIITGTLGKALGGAAGGYVAGSKTLIDYLQQVSRPQLFSNALPATIAASAMKAIEILEREPGRVERLHAITRQAARRAEGARLQAARRRLAPSCRSSSATRRSPSA